MVLVMGFARSGKCNVGDGAPYANVFVMTSFSAPVVVEAIRNSHGSAAKPRNISILGNSGSRGNMQMQSKGASSRDPAIAKDSAGVVTM